MLSKQDNSENLAEGERLEELPASAQDIMDIFEGKIVDQD